RLSSSAFMLGLLGFAQFLPVMLFSLWAGVVADRVDKRRLILVTQSAPRPLILVPHAAALLQAAALAALVSAGVARPWMVVALAFLFGTISAFDLPARQAFLGERGGEEGLRE